MLAATSSGEFWPWLASASASPTSFGVGPCAPMSMLARPLAWLLWISLPRLSKPYRQQELAEMLAQLIGERETTGERRAAVM